MHRAKFTLLSLSLRRCLNKLSNLVNSSHNTQTTTYEDPRKNKVEDVPTLPTFHHTATGDDVMLSLRNIPLRCEKSLLRLHSMTIDSGLTQCGLWSRAETLAWVI